MELVDLELVHQPLMQQADQVVVEMVSGGPSTDGNAGTANTGGGGGGGHCGENAYAGGSLVVLIQYPGAQRAGGGTVSCVSCKTQHLFSGSGTFTTKSGPYLDIDYLVVAGGGAGGQMEEVLHVTLVVEVEQEDF